MNRSKQARTVAAAAALTATVSLVAGCGSAASQGPAELSDEPVTLSMTWWGNDVRQSNTQAIIDAFEAEHPNITIEPSFADWGGYWDKLATETAANNSADIIQMDEKYISTYASRGALYDLAELGDSLDTSGFPESALAATTVEDGLYGLPAGLTAYAIVANPDLFAQAGVELPDDTTWQWEDLQEIATQLSTESGGAFYGMQSFGFEEGGLRLWARINDDNLYNEDGSVGLDEETATGFWELIKGLADSGAAPAPSATIERQGGGLSESFTATNTAALATWWNSQLTALTEASGSPLELLQAPGAASADAYWYKPSMIWSISSRSEHPAEAALFLDFLVNSEEAADIQLTERGVPANETIREYITPKLSDTDQQVAAFLDEISVGEPETVTPAGASGIEALIKQYTEQVLFGQTTPEEAAASFIRDLSAEIESAR